MAENGIDEKEKDLMIEGLFNDLGTRLSKENHLSDVTWAIAKNSGEFLHAFMDFFGYSLVNDAPLEIIREYMLDDRSRPDIVIENGNDLFIVECKIYDRNYHFEQYGKAVAPEGKRVKELGIILNHRLDDHSRDQAEIYQFKVRTWESYISVLEGKIAEKKFDSNCEPCIKAYIKYVKEVCSIMELREIRFGNLISLFHFNTLVKKVIEESDYSGFECKLHNVSRAFGEDWSGRYFSLKPRNGEVTLYPFFGIYYREQPLICFAFERDWCREYYFKYKKKGKEGNFYQIEKTKSEVRFKLSQDKFTEFNRSTLDEQERILEDFFNKVVDEVAPYL